MPLTRTRFLDPRNRQLHDDLAKGVGHWINFLGQNPTKNQCAKTIEYPSRLFTEYFFKAIPSGAGFRAPLGIATGLLKINGHFTGGSERQVHPRA